MKKWIGTVAIAAATSAGAQWHEDISDSKEYRYAATGNDSGSILGQFCYLDDKCYWVVAMQTSCESDNAYPALAANEKTAMHADLVCRGPVQMSGKTYFRYFLGPFDKIDSAVRDGMKLAVVFPLQSGTFEVHRFSTVGAIKSIDAMRSKAAQEQSRGTRNQRL